MRVGASVWTFLRPLPGELHAVTQCAVNEFLRSEGRLSADAEGHVRCAQVVVKLENRQAVQVLRVGFYQYRALMNGRLDRRHFRKVMAVVPEVAFGGLQLTKPKAGVVSAEHRFAKRRLDYLSLWKPTHGDLSKLRELVNLKAGRDIM